MAFIYKLLVDTGKRESICWKCWITFIHDTFDFPFLCPTCELSPLKKED